MAEKMLTNWFTFLLYKFLKVRLDIGVSLVLPVTPPASLHTLKPTFPRPNS